MKGSYDMGKAKDKKETKPAESKEKAPAAEKLVTVPGKCIVTSRLLRPVVVSVKVDGPEDPETHEATEVNAKVKIWPGVHRRDKAPIEKALKSQWLKDFCKEQGKGDGEVGDFFTVKPLKVPKSEAE